MLCEPCVVFEGLAVGSWRSHGVMSAFHASALAAVTHVHPSSVLRMRVDVLPARVGFLRVRVRVVDAVWPGGHGVTGHVHRFRQRQCKRQRE